MYCRCSLLHSARESGCLIPALQYTGTTTDCFSHRRSRVQNKYAHRPRVVSFSPSQVSSFGMATPPVTPPLSAASSHHGSTTSISSSSYHMSNSIDGRSGGRKRLLTRKNLVGNAFGRGNDVLAGYGERPYGEVAPSFSPSRPSASSCLCGDGYGNGDSGDDQSGHGRRAIPPRLLRPPAFPPTKTPKSPLDGSSGRPRRRRRCCCCRFSSRCLLVVGLCLATAYLTFKAVWWLQWQARCVEGCYDPSAAKTGSRGPEQVRSAFVARNSACSRLVVQASSRPPSASCPLL